MKLANGEFVETCHSSLRQSDERHGFKVKRKLGTPIHMQKSWQQSCKKRETLHDPEIFIQNFRQDILHHQFFLKSQVAPLKQKIIAQLKKRVCNLLHYRAFFKITTSPSRAENYRTTKNKKRSCDFYTVSNLKFYTVLKFFTRSWIARISAYCNSG